MTIIFILLIVSKAYKFSIQEYKENDKVKQFYFYFLV